MYQFPLIYCSVWSVIYLKNCNLYCAKWKDIFKLYEDSRGLNPPELLAYRSIGYNRRCQGKAEALMMLWGCTGWSESAHVMYAWRQPFALCDLLIFSALLTLSLLEKKWIRPVRGDTSTREVITPLILPWITWKFHIQFADHRWPFYHRRDGHVTRKSFDSHV